MVKTSKPIVHDAAMQIRISKELREAAQRKADANSQNLSELIRKFLQNYVDEK